MTIPELLFEKRDEDYARFQAGLTPTVAAEKIIGVRVPELRKMAKLLVKDEQTKAFLRELPHQYYDENMLHGLIVAELRDYEECLAELEFFLPFIDNWAVCDITSPGIFKKHKAELIGKIRQWTQSDHVYTARFGLEMLMTHYLDADYKPEYLEIAAAAKGEDYYLKMMVAWFFATALAKQWESAVPYLESKQLPVWIHNKTIQKARESYRVSPEKKEYLNTLKQRQKISDKN